MPQAMSIDKWSLLTNAITLLVITATAVAALIQLRHLRAQNTLNAELAILKDWNDPQFRQWRLYVAGEMQTKIKDPAFLAEYDAPEVDRSRHPELYACDWLEQIGSYLKYDCSTPTSCSTSPQPRSIDYGISSHLQLNGCVLRAVTVCTRTLSIGRQKAVYGRRRIQEEPTPGTCLECATSKALASALAPYFARRSSATLQSNGESTFRRQHCHSALVTRFGRTFSA